MTHAPASNRHHASTRVARHIATTLAGARRRKHAICIALATGVLVLAGILEARSVTLEARLAARRRDLASVQQLGTDYRELRAALIAADRSAAPRPGTTPASMWRAVEAAARGTVGTDHVASLTPADADARNTATGMPGDMPPPRHGLELRVEGAPLTRIVDLLHRLEHGVTSLDVERLRITHAPTADGALDATLAIVGSIPAQ